MTNKYKTVNNTLLLRLGELNLDFETLDIEKAVYTFKKIDLSHTTVSYVSLTESTPDSIAKTVENTIDTTSATFNVGFREINLADIHVFYQSRIAGQILKADIGEFQTKADTFDLVTQQIVLDKFTLENSFINYTQEKNGKIIPVATTQESEETVTLPWQVKVKSLNLSKNYLVYNDENQKPQPKGMDFSHLVCSNISVKANDVAYAGTAIKADIESMQLQEKSGFELKQLQTTFLLNDTQAQISALTFQTANSSIKGDMKANFRSLERIADEYPDMNVAMNLEKSRLSVQDLLFFQPELLQSIPLRLKNTMFLDVKSQISGKVKDLRIDEFTANTLDNTQLSLKGYIRNLPDFDKSVFRLDIQSFETSDTDIITLLPRAMLPQSVRLPARIRLTAEFAGALHSFNTQATLNTT
ncbi:MAG: hypothetical protein H7Y04_14955, partial [Verrucomicrobia bacterium]|nr:hypothetical protein [Cytophagales bacterium]